MSCVIVYYNMTQMSMGYSINLHENLVAPSIHSLLKNEPRNGIIHLTSLEKKVDHYGNVLQKTVETAHRPRHDSL